MSQPSHWLWGLIPLSLLWGAGNLVLDRSIQADVARRAEAAVQAVAGSTPGARPAFAQVVGRDVTISGEVLSADGASKAMARLRSEFGVRRALGGLSQVIAQKPYSWFVSRQPDAVTVGGFVPDAATADATVSALRQALPGVRIDDRQSIAFGAPDGFAAMATGIVAALPSLQTGRISLDDRRVCVEGVATSASAFLGLHQAAGPSMPGFTAVPCDLKPPVVEPYRWVLEKSAGGAVTLDGFYPDETMRQRILAEVRTNLSPAAEIADSMLPGAGAPPNFTEIVARAARDLARLGEGRATLLGDIYSLAGKGPDDHDACEALKIQIAQQDGPGSVARLSIACPPAPPPPVVVTIPPLPELPGLILDDVQPPASAASPAPAAPPLPEPAKAEAAAPPASPAPAPAPTLAAPLVPWTARLGPDGVILAGAIPDEATRAALLAAVERLFPGKPISDRMTVAAKAPAASLLPSASYALSALSALASGTVELREGRLTLSGAAGDARQWRSVQAALAAIPPAGLSLAIEADAIAVRPYELTLQADRSGFRLAGVLPDEAARSALRALVADSPLADRFDDGSVIAPGAPAGFADAARVVAADLLRLDLGSATITDRHIDIKGLTCRELIAKEVETSASSGLPAGFTASVAISPRQTGCVLDPPASCQNDLDALTRQNPVLFGQGTDAVVLDPTTDRVIGEAADILKRCPGAKVTIEGHANRDGAWRGFDNQGLSQRRAERVREELARRGIDVAGLTVKGYGIDRPLLPHGTAHARDMNRRVQFTVAR